jgi:protein-S-isoprenylcysteine O-methyltransferase Ste14
MSWGDRLGIIAICIVCLGCLITYWQWRDEWDDDLPLPPERKEEK